jgi:hypothetical protein
LSEDSWAVVSVRIASDGLTAREIERLLGRPGDSRSEEVFSADLTDDRGVPLDDQIKIAKAWVREHSAVLAGMAGADIALHIGWTPRDPQDGIIMDRELIALLHEVGGYVLLDTYLD